MTSDSSPGPSLPRRRTTTRGIALALLIAAVAVVGLRNRHQATHRAAPPLPARTLSGRPVTLADLHGRSAALVFWASWCTDCHTEAAAVERFASSAAGRGRVVGIDTSDGGDWRGFVRRYRWSFPILADPDGTTLSAYGVRIGLPATVFLDPDGRIAGVRYGRESVAGLRSALAASS